MKFKKRGEDDKSIITIHSEGHVLKPSIALALTAKHKVKRLT
jgi:hypothetical protein